LVSDIQAFKEEHRLRVFEARVLRIIFAPRRDEETGGWRKLYDEELHNLYSSPSIIIIIKPKRMRRTRHVARMKYKNNAYGIFVGKRKGKRPLRRSKRRWKNNSKMDDRGI
jgi:hypothetical protein